MSSTPRTAALHDTRRPYDRPELLDTKLGARIYFSGEDPEHLRRRIRANQVPEAVTIRIGRRIYLRRRALEAWLGITPSQTTNMDP